MQKHGEKQPQRNRPNSASTSNHARLIWEGVKDIVIGSLFVWVISIVDAGSIVLVLLLGTGVFILGLGVRELYQGVQQRRRWMAMETKFCLVTDRFFRMSGFITNAEEASAQTSSTATFAEYALTEARYAYFLLVVDPDNGLARWLIVAKDVFDAHPKDTTYQIKTPEPEVVAGPQ